MAAMDVEASPILEAQRAAHPELSESLDQIQKYANGKLYHQLTHALVQYVQSPPLLLPTAAAELLEFFNGFIRPFENKFDKLRLVQLITIICKSQAHEVALEVITPFETSVASHRDARCLLQSLKAEKLVLANQLDAAKDLLETLGIEMDTAYEVDARIQSQYHKTNALMWKHLGRSHEFYKSSILYLAFTTLDSIAAEERPRLAFEVGVAALIAEEEFNYGELLQQEILASVDGTEHAWIKDLLQAFGEGKFEMYDAALSKYRAQIDATPELKKAEGILRHKMSALALMELAFRKPKKQRRLTFDEIAQHCRVGLAEVEYLVMKTMCSNLIKGQIDEVVQLVMVTWVKPRLLDNVRLDLMRERCDAWSAQTGLLLDHLEEMTPELLVS